MKPDESQIRLLTGKWDYQDLPDNIQIGQDCWLERKASFDRFRSQQLPGLVLGDRVRVALWTNFNVEPSGRIEVGDDSVLVGAVFMCGERISVGKNVLISYHVTIADSDFHPIDPELRRLDAIANSPMGDKSKRPTIECRPVVIEDDVSIGIGAMILKGVHIGKGARIGPGSVVTSDILAGTEVEGNPARFREMG